MSDTPETDAHIARLLYKIESEVDADFARKLERERNEAREILNGDRLSPVGKMWQRCFAAESERDQLLSELKLLKAKQLPDYMVEVEKERDQLRKVCDELSNWQVGSFEQRHAALESYNSLPHVIERNKAK